jgi:hypothetical protein
MREKKDGLLALKLTQVCEMFDVRCAGPDEMPVQGSKVHLMIVISLLVVPIRVKCPNIKP